MKTVQDRLAAFKEHCRKTGLKATHQRTEIYRELAATEVHPDAETIFRNVRERIPAMSFDTVYRTLRTLEEKGLIARVGTPLERSRFDANMMKHHHFVCDAGSRGIAPIRGLAARPFSTNSRAHCSCIRLCRRNGARCHCA